MAVSKMLNGFSVLLAEMGIGNLLISLCLCIHIYIYIYSYMYMRFIEKIRVYIYMYAFFLNTCVYICV